MVIHIITIYGNAHHNYCTMQKVKVMLERAEELKKKLNAMFMAEYEEVMLLHHHYVIMM